LVSLFTCPFNAPGGLLMATQDFKRRLTAIFSADVEGYSRLMREKEITNGINKGIIQDRSWAFK
jgi:hypothetical protein